MAFDANDLSPHEQFVVDRTRNGEVADFSPMSTADGGKPSVRAGFIRKFLLELEAEWPVRTPGVRLKGARIEGVLDLTDCSGAGGAGLPSLSLEGCDLAEAVDLSWARVARVALRACRIRKLTAPHAVIDGELDLSSTAPLEAAGAAVKPDVDAFLPATYYLHAQRVRRWLLEQTSPLFREVDFLLTPAALGPAPLGHGGGDNSMNSPWATLGMPAMTFTAIHRTSTAKNDMIAMIPFQRSSRTRIAVATPRSWWS